MGVIKRLRGVVDEFGWGAGSVYLVDLALRRLSPRCGAVLYELMGQPVGGALLPPVKTAVLHSALIRPGDPDLAHVPVPDAVKAARFAQGAECLGVYRKGQLIGYVWFAQGTYDEDEVRCTYDLARVPDSAWDFDLYLLPEHRMGTGFPAIWHCAFEHLARRDVQTSYSRVSRFNLASRRAHARLGSVRVGRLLGLKLGALQIVAADLPPWVGLTWRDGQSVRLRLRDMAHGGGGAVAATPRSRGAGHGQPPGTGE